MNPKTYEEQRKQRLDEAVFDYIQDEQVTPKQFYEELQEVLLNNSKYFQEQAMRVDRMRQLVTEGLESPDMSRYSQYTEAEIDAMCHEADRKSKEEINLQIQADSPFNDGWTQEFYREQLKELKDSKDQKHSKYYYDFDRNR